MTIAKDILPYFPIAMLLVSIAGFGYYMNKNDISDNIRPKAYHQVSRPELWPGGTRNLKRKGKQANKSYKRRS
jgi:hypothetical protein